MNMSLRQLRAFVTVARAGSFIHAAASLNLTQAAVSHLVRDLEGVVGVRLLERTTRSVRLSRAGAIFLPHAECVLGTLGSAELCAMDLRRGRTGEVRIAGTHLLCSVKLPGPIAAYQEAHPGTRISLLDRGPDELGDLVANGVVDIALGPERPVSPHVIAELAFADELMFVCAAHHRLAARAHVRWADLAGETFVMAGRGAALRTMQDIQYAVAIRPVVEVEHFTTALALVGAGQGIGASTAYVRPYLAIHGLRMLPLREPRVLRRIMLYRHAEREPTPVARNVTAYLRECLSTGSASAASA